MDNVLTASAKAALQNTGSDTLTAEAFNLLINSAADEVMDQYFGEPGSDQLEGFFRSVDQRQASHTIQTKTRPNTTVPLNRDADDLTFIEAGQGFGYTFNTYDFRLAVKHERKLSEVDDVSAIGDQYDWLADASKRTLKNALADAINRNGILVDNAPFLCLDGMYMIDSARPNPDPKAPAWSNLEAAGAITDDSLFAAMLNANNTIGPNGDKLRQKISKILIPQEQELAMWTLTNSQNVVGSANNDANWAKARFSYEVVDEMTDDQILYLMTDAKDKKNGLQIRWRVRPGLADIDFENPDVMGKRIRFSFGLGCLDPRYTWRGGKLS
jgi:hypothetical protein